MFNITFDNISLKNFKFN